MGNRGWFWFGVVVLLSGCEGGGASAPGEHGDDGFAVGTAPLALLQAAPGLCEGGGSDKECGPEGCAEAPAGASDSTASRSGGSSAGLPAGNAAPTPSASGGSVPIGSAPPSSGPSGDGQYSGGTGGYGGTGGGDTATAGMGAPPPDDEPACLLADGGVAPPDAGSCQDGGVAMASAALITDDVPACGMTDPGEATTLFMSADDSGSMAAPVIARHLIETGRQVPAHVVRPWEFLNYYDFSFEPAAPGEVRMVPQLSSCPRNDRLSLQVALQAEARAPGDRAPITLTFVLDTSGSMGGSPIAFERAAVLAMASQLRVGDVVSMVTWNTAQNVILAGHEVSGPDDPVVVQAATALTAGGGTDLHAGLTTGYGLAEQHYGAGRINRVVLISDGKANVGITDEALIAGHADDEEGDAGIYLSGIGVGDGVNDTLMNAVTDAGRGTYVYLDSQAEAQRMLGERFLQVVDLAVRNVRLEVTLPYHLVLEEFFGEVASTDASKVRPQHLSPNDAMLFLQVLRACEPSLLRGDDRIRMRATWETPFEREAREVVVDTTLNALAGDDADLTKAAAIAAYADALTAVADLPRGDAGRNEILDDALSTVTSAAGADSDPDLLEVTRLLQRYRGP